MSNVHYQIKVDIILRGETYFRLDFRSKSKNTNILKNINKKEPFFSVSTYINSLEKLSLKYEYLHDEPYLTSLSNACQK